MVLELVQRSIIYTRSSQVSFKLLFNIVFTSKKRWWDGNVKYMLYQNCARYD